MLALEGIGKKKMEIVPYTEDLIPAVKGLNERLKNRGSTWTFFETPHPLPQFKNPNGRVFVEAFLAMEDGFVRGAYALKKQDFLVDGKEITIAHFWVPVSEGIINQAYSMVAVRLLAHARKKQSLLFDLGMGGFQENLPRFLKASRWALWEMPFYFKVIHPSNFLKNITVLRTTCWKRLALDILAISGLGWIGIKALNAFSHRARVPSVLRVQTVRVFPALVDSLWNECKAVHNLTAIRDRKLIEKLYPENDDKNIKLIFYDESKIVGWTVVRNTPMRNHKQFGHMRVASLVDGIALPHYTDQVVYASAKFLTRQDADIIVSNQSSTSWCKALARAGFRRGPSNFLFAVSPELAKRIEGLNRHVGDWHINRGDGDGPINL
jgi:hypothetical protein